VKSTVETLSPTRVRLAVEVPFDELKPSLDKAYKSIAKQVKIPGFRPGRVPAAVIDQRIGRAAVLDEAVNDAVPRAYTEAIRSNDVRALGNPDIELTQVDPSTGIAFTAEVDVRPEMRLPELASLAVTVDTIEVTEEELDERVGVLREKFAMLKSVERPVADGDYVSVDLRAEVEGEEVESRTGLSYEVGSGTVIPGLDEALVGLEVGEEKTFDADLTGGEHQGKTAVVLAVVRSIKEKELPDLDDDFAQTASEFDTLAELRDDVRRKLEQRKQADQGIQARDHVLSALLEATEVPLPESVVSAEQKWRRTTLEQQLAQAGLSLDQYLSAQEQDTEQFDAELRTTAEQAVKTQLVLDALAESEHLGVAEAELVEHVMANAQRYGLTPEDYVQRMSEAGNLPAMVAEVRRDKALLAALEAATVTDTAGNPVDLAEQLRRGDAAPPAVASEVAEASEAEEASEVADAARPAGA